MLRGWAIYGLLATFGTVSLAVGQPVVSGTTPALPSQVAPPAQAAIEPPIANGFDVTSKPSSRFYSSASFLLWWTEGQFVPPLVTTSPQGTLPADAGVLGNPTTTVLFGGRRLNTGIRLGGRVTAGYWLDDGFKTALEGDFLALQDLQSSFVLASTGDPILARPIFNVLTNSQDAVLTAFPGIVTGSIYATASTSAVFGAELNLRRNVFDDCCCRVDILGGYRFLGFNDTVQILDTEISEEQRFDVLDFFQTSNRFHGAQLGLVATTHYDCWFFEARAKLAMGVTVETADVVGATSTNSGPPVSGGVLAVVSNIGHYNRAAFAVLPELTLTASRQITSRLRASLGYTFMYLSSVARAGEQIDLNINPNLFPPPVVAGPLLPQFRFNPAGFWMTGLNFGLQFQF
jgi:Putative beta barrel porin-7 (BBP7)